MHRIRFSALAAAVTVTVAVAPVFGAVALAADPTIVVRPGDTLTGISKRVNVPMAELVRLNAMADPNRIYAGQTLRTGEAPAASAEAAPAAAAPPAPVPSAAAVHTVQRGENLTRIARHYGVSVADIVAANGLANPSRIFGGQQLTIPGTAAAPVAEAAPAPAPAAPAMPESMAARVANRADVRQVIVEEATRYGVPPAFALAVAWQESGWQQGVVSSAGAVGVMQLMPATAVWVGEAMLGAPVNMHDLRDNVRAGTRLLAHYLSRYGGDRNLTLAAYYQGQRAADRYGVYPVTRPYISSILVLEALFGG